MSKEANGWWPKKGACRAHKECIIFEPNVCCNKTGFSLPNLAFSDDSLTLSASSQNFIPIFSSLMYSLMQETLSSSDDRLPFFRLYPNYRVPRPSSPSSSPYSSSSSSSSEAASPTSIEEHPSVRKEQHRRKLLGLHHAAYCTHVGHTPCPGHSHCMAHKRIFTHMNSCREGAKCIIPGCAKARLIWTHFSTCTLPECSICSVIPQQEQQNFIPPVKAHLPRSPKLSASAKRPGRPPLSPKLKYHHELPPRSPPRSPTLKMP